MRRGKPPQIIIESDGTRMASAYGLDFKSADASALRARGAVLSCVRATSLPGILVQAVIEDCRGDRACGAAARRDVVEI